MKTDIKKVFRIDNNTIELIFDDIVEHMYTSGVVFFDKNEKEVMFSDTIKEQYFSTLN